MNNNIELYLSGGDIFDMPIHPRSQRLSQRGEKESDSGFDAYLADALNKEVYGKICEDVPGVYILAA